MLETVTGGFLMCAGGESMLMFDALPEVNVLVQAMPAGHFMDVVPDLNLTPMGICAILSEVGLPIPCMPAPVSPWMIGDPTVLINGMPALDNLSMVPCAWGGVISIVFPNNETTWLTI
ncbi:hypothetical protein Cva_01134 [Caedimonas varicaedens]|jgi:hypothetical protein|uniref:DUF4280 domain-containing protein n=1 Tax=Caedimonas varicaedens TaxID=1629334 RepID=A0A0K8ME47_9PROT|nr:hypothetical protein Cva_01134 [Caedimonas varicaedens]